MFGRILSSILVWLFLTPPLLAGVFQEGIAISHEDTPFFQCAEHIQCEEDNSDNTIRCHTTDTALEKGNHILNIQIPHGYQGYTRCCSGIQYNSSENLIISTLPPPTYDGAHFWEKYIGVIKIQV